MKRKKQIALLCAFVLSMTAFGGCASDIDVSENTENEEVEEVYEKVPVTSLRAQDDFYGYVNLEKLNSLNIGWNSTDAGSWSEISDLVDDQLDDIIKEIAASSESYPEGSSAQVIRAAYDQYMAYSGPDDLSNKRIEEVFAKIESVSSVEEYMQLMSEMYREYGVGLLLVPATSINYFDAKEYGTFFWNISSICDSVSIKSFAKNNSASQGLKRKMVSFLTCEGISKDAADQSAVDMISMMLEVARASDIELYEQKMYYMNSAAYELDELDDKLTNIDLKKYMTDCGANALPENVYVVDEKQLFAINDILTEDNLPALKNYAKMTFCMNYGDFLPDKYANFRNKYFGITNDIQREYETKSIIKQLFTKELGELYAERYGDERKKQYVEDLCEEMRSSYNELITNCDWLSDETKTLLCRKLSNVKFLVGASDSSKLERCKDPIGPNCLETMVNMNSYNANSIMNKIGIKYPDDVIQMDPQTVNAYYAANNTVSISYAILNAPIFDMDASKSQNLGMIGMIIAHEMSHAFDSNMIKYNADGIYDPDWLPAADREAFENKMKQTEEYYNNFTIMDVYHVDGELTLGENFADLGAWECIMSIPGTAEEKKERMESFASLWCTLSIDVYALSSLRDDCHSPDAVRVNAIVASCDEFYDLYDVKEGDKMYIAPENRVSRW